MTLINRGVKNILRYGQQRSQQSFKNNDYPRNDDRFYHYGKPGHIKQNFPELRRRSSKKHKNFRSWSNENKTEEDTKTVNMCFLAIKESSEVRPFSCHNCNILPSNRDIIHDEIQKFINKYNKIA